MEQDDKNALAGLAILVVLAVVGFFIYKFFIGYKSYDECVGDRTLKSGMTNAQVRAQMRYCEDYFD
tara:strand:+ start:8 stop:205 length:198 start_codon:yes stop_codon:yes gene_type:complete